ncbi:MAG: hypothetical protein JNK48_22620 [Bryobacterales bacterium]|nr:hypothetical protein [Bryobacterales bacterium]
MLVLYLNLAGLALLAQRWTGSYALARVWSPVALCLALFFAEHIAGLGDLRWLGYACSLASLILCYRGRALLRRHWPIEAAFAAGFCYSLLWRFHFPDLDGTHSEKLTDFTFILNYSRGEKLPPVDSWFPPHPFSMYYALQHYGAALLGRMLGALPGQAYHLAFSTMIGLTSAAAWAAIEPIARRTRWRLLLMAALLAGGTGATLVIHGMKPEVYPYDTMRFIGGTATPAQAVKPFGQWLVRGVPRQDALELPIETFGYLIQLGDYHPPLSGFLLLMGALAAIAAIETSGAPVAWALLAAGVPLTVASNTWSLPLQALLAGGYVLFRLWRRQRVEWLPAACGGFAVTALLSPFLYHFLRTSSGGKMALRFVPWDAHTPPVLGAILLLPPLLILAASLYDKTLPPLARFFSLLWVLCFVFSEVFYIDDLYSGRYTRFNTTLKWWGWTMAGAMTVTAAALLESKRRMVRCVTTAALLISCAYYYDLAGFFFRTPSPHSGKLQGWSTLTGDPPHEAVFAYLLTKPRTTMLQRLDKGSYTLSPGLVLFAGHTPFLGWPDHEKVWRGDLPEILERDAEVRFFYFAQMNDPLAWLKKHNITHVLWLRTEHSLPAGTWERLNASIGINYRWREFFRMDDWRIGVWERVE